MVIVFPVLRFLPCYMLNRQLVHESGFSLIEAMLAFMVVGFGLLGLAKLQNDFFKNNGNSRVHTAALNFAQQKIEHFRGFATQNDYDSLSGLEDETADSCDPMSKASLCQGINTTLERTWSVADCPDALPCRLVSINVVWMDVDGIRQKITLSSYIAGYEPVKSGVALAQ